MSGQPWTREELLAVSASRLLEDGKVVFAGVGVPLLASILARSTHAPHRPQPYPQLWKVLRSPS